MKSANDLISATVDTIMTREPSAVTTTTRSQRDNKIFPMFPFEDPPTQINSYGEV